MKLRTTSLNGSSMLNHVIKVILISILTLNGWSQTIEFEHTVKVKFDDVPLVQVLETMTKMYDFKFSYIPEKMPLEQRVFWNPVDAPNQQNVENFLNEHRIQFIKIGDQYVLRYHESQENLVDVSELLPKHEKAIVDELSVPRSHYEVTYLEWYLHRETTRSELPLWSSYPKHFETHHHILEG